jgi:hypothetical protein
MLGATFFALPFTPRLSTAGAGAFQRYFIAEGNLYGFSLEPLWSKNANLVAFKGREGTTDG